jgi:hypothetical protein
MATRIREILHIMASMLPSLWLMSVLCTTIESKILEESQNSFRETFVQKTQSFALKSIWGMNATGCIDVCDYRDAWCYRHLKWNFVRILSHLSKNYTRTNIVTRTEIYLNKNRLRTDTYELIHTKGRTPMSAFLSFLRKGLKSIYGYLKIILVS